LKQGGVALSSAEPSSFRATSKRTRIETSDEPGNLEWIEAFRATSKRTRIETSPWSPSCRAWAIAFQSNIQENKD